MLYFDVCNKSVDDDDDDDDDDELQHIVEFVDCVRRMAWILAFYFVHQVFAAHFFSPN